MITSFPLASIEWPEDIAVDPRDGSYWISSARSPWLLQMSSDFETELQRLPFLADDGPCGALGCLYATGLAVDSHNEDLLVVAARSDEVLSIDPADGSIVGAIPVPFPAEARGTLVRGLTFDPSGDGGRGSVYAVLQFELPVANQGVVAVDRLVELTREGNVTRSFDLAHEVLGEVVRAIDVELIHEAGAVVGFWIIVHGTQSWILKLDGSGAFTGTFVPLAATRARVSGILHQSFRRPDDGVILDAILCTLESADAVAVVEAGERRVFELSDLRCNSSGGEVTLEWRSWQALDAVEVLRDGDLLAVLAGDATSIADSTVSAGRHEYVVRGRLGLETGDPSVCTVWVDSAVGEVLDVIAPSDGPCTLLRCVPRSYSGGNPCHGQCSSRVGSPHRRYDRSSNRRP